MKRLSNNNQEIIKVFEEQVIERFKSELNVVLNVTVKKLENPKNLTKNLTENFKESLLKGFEEAINKNTKIYNYACNVIQKKYNYECEEKVFQPIFKTIMEKINKKKDEYVNYYINRYKEKMSKIYPEGIEKFKENNDLTNMKIGDSKNLTIKLWEHTKYRDGAFIIYNNIYMATTKGTHTNLIAELLRAHPELLEIENNTFKTRDYGFKNEEINSVKEEKKCFGYIIKQQDKTFALIDEKGISNYSTEELINILKQQNYNGIFLVDESNNKKTVRIAKHI